MLFQKFLLCFEPSDWPLSSFVIIKEPQHRDHASLKKSIKPTPNSLCDVQETLTNRVSLYLFKKLDDFFFLQELFFFSFFFFHPSLSLFLLFFLPLFRLYLLTQKNNNVSLFNKTSKEKFSSLP